MATTTLHPIRTFAIAIALTASVSGPIAAQSIFDREAFPGQRQADFDAQQSQMRVEQDRMREQQNYLAAQQRDMQMQMDRQRLLQQQQQMLDHNAPRYR